ncbi:MAG: hypothetical protein ACKOBN_07230 [Flavobacteriales bacterium]
MRNLFVLLLLLILPLFSTAQKSKKQAVVYDVVELKNGKVLYGKMIALDNNYVLTFRDEYNRMYYLSKEMYNYIEEDRTFQKRVRHYDSIVKPRKVDEFDFHVGISTQFAGIDNGFIADDYYVSSNSYGMFFETPVCLNLGIGKYFKQQHYFGVELNLKAIGGPQKFNQAALQYQFIYDPMKTDIARYIPINIGLQSFSTIETFQVPDMTMPPLPNYINKDFSIDVQSLNLGIGHGWAFIGKDKHFWNLELLFYKGIWSKYLLITNELTDPKLNFQTAGLQFKLGYHF